jgi:hypothetical protein
MALGTTAAILLGLGAAGGGMAVSKLSAPKQQISAPIPLPQPPSSDTVMGKAQDTIQKKRATLSQSVYTSPLGVAGEANVARKTLLGQ